MTLEIYPYFPERPGYVQLLENPPEERIKDGFLDVPDEPRHGRPACGRTRPPLPVGPVHDVNGALAALECPAPVRMRSDPQR